MWVGSVGYRLLATWQRSRSAPAESIGIPVISVGNITVGGTGKTPVVHFLARLLLSEGVRVGIVSSGYGRRSQAAITEPGYKVQKLSADETGDEVRLLAGFLPEAVFSVDRSKLTAARRLAEAGDVDVVIVDDGFQHPRLARDLDIVTYDAAVPRRQLKMFPYGILREPLSALKRADVIIVTRSNFAVDIGQLHKSLEQLNPDAEHYRAQFRIDTLVGHSRRLPVKYLEDKSVLLFAGVGNFRPLHKQVAALAGDLDYALELSDHQHYDRQLLQRIRSLAEHHDSDVIVTTGKDWVKLPDFDFGCEIYYLAQSTDLDPGEEKLIAYVLKRLELKRHG